MKLFILTALLIFFTFNVHAGVINNAARSAIQRRESHLSDSMDQVLQLTTQKLETPNAPETTSSPTQDTASSLELTSAPAVLDDNTDEQWCGYGYLWTFPCPEVLSSPPSLSKIHILIIEYVSAIPGKIAASFGTSTTSTELKGRDIPTTDSGGLGRRQSCTPNLVDGTLKCCFPDLVDGGLKCNAGSSLSPPRIFALPTLLFKALLSAPQALAAAVPPPLPISRNPSEENHVEERQGTVSNCWINEMGMRQCFTFTPNVGSSSLSIPRIFSLPTLFITLIKQVSSVSALPQHLTASLAAPNFDLVRKTVHEAGEAFNNWREMDKRQLPVCRPGQPPNLPCKNSASRFGLSYLLSILLLAFGVMVWL